VAISERKRKMQRDWYAKGGTPGESQVYALLGTDHLPRYIGVSVSAQQRTKTHWQQRARRTTPVANWLRTLAEPPEVWIIQKVPTAQGRATEAHWIKTLDQVPGIKLLNVERTGRRPPMSDDTKAKIAAANRGRSKNLTDEQRAAMSARSRGRTHSDATRKQMHESQQRSIASGAGREQRRQAVLARWARYREQQSSRGLKDGRHPPEVV
jgi:NUMOD3 motif